MKLYMATDSLSFCFLEITLILTFSLVVTFPALFMFSLIKAALHHMFLNK